MTNEQLVEEIRNGVFVTGNMQILYDRNIALIKKIIKPYGSYEDTDELLQEAYFGLWNAVQHYETSENVLFMTYARYWIVQAVQRYIDDVGSVVRIPSYEKQKIIQYKKKQQEYIKEYGRTPTDKELSEYMCVSIAKIEEYKRYSIGISSIDVPLAEDSEDTLTDTLKCDLDIEGETLDNILNECLRSELWGIIKRNTTTIENQILCARFKDKETLQSIGDKLGISRELVRQLEQRGLQKLKRRKAKQDLAQKVEVIESELYKTGLKKFEESNTSTVEKVAIRKQDVLGNYERLVREYEKITRFKK
jgi:RNA polymerase primary sigma factor